MKAHWVPEIKTAGIYEADYQHTTQPFTLRLLHTQEEPVCLNRAADSLLGLRLGHVSADTGR